MMSTARPVANDISLVITTYNRPQFLEMVLRSVLTLRTLPCEVVIADDGSGKETKDLIDRYKSIFPIPLIHSWIEDHGYRLSKSRNVAIAQTSGSYIVQIDGDIVLSPYFIEDHAALAQKGYFVTGDRARLSEGATERHTRKLDTKFSPFTWGLARPLTMLHSPWLNKFMKGHSGLNKIRGCHMAFFKDDLIRVNGYEERFFGWGSEDFELAQRFFHVGLKRKSAKLMACCVHLYHEWQDRGFANQNEKLLQETIDNKSTWAQIGIDQYL